MEHKSQTVNMSTMTLTKVNLPKELNIVIDKIINLDSLRVEVEKTVYYYNMLKNTLEYKLENGGYRNRW